MRRCLAERAFPRQLRSQCVLPEWRFLSRAQPNYINRYSTQAGDKGEADVATASRFDVFKRVQFPVQEERQDVAVWASLLEDALPVHLRENKSSSPGSILSVRDAAQIILAYREESRIQGRATDLLFHLGVEKGRWRALVWLVKGLVDVFAPIHLRSSRLSKTICSWNFDQSLSEITQNAINTTELGSVNADFPRTTLELQTLEELTDKRNPEALSRDNQLCHSVLGSIWLSLGKMSIAYADEEIRPEILEIIAYLHHKEIMPISIYNQKPAVDATAVQQPLMINLFSSRILTSLSDAAWRAHESLVVEEAKVKGVGALPLRPEIPGKAYRVNVAGLRPMVWLELILWSCLRGGWVIEGANILATMYSQPSHREWKPLSWKWLADYAVPEQNWDKLEYLFNTQHPSASRESGSQVNISVQRTISSEVINAFVDALLSGTRLDIGERGIAPVPVLRRLVTLHKFLGRSGLALESNSWDAIILRFIDMEAAVLHQRKHFNLLLRLFPKIGDEVKSSNAQMLPSYLLDGSAAMLGLFHQALRSRIHAGDASGALLVFEAVQTLADQNKRQSVVDFLQKQQSAAFKPSDTAVNMFTDNIDGIEYPAFDLQIPDTVLGPFIELLTDAKAFDFIRWLLSGDEIDEPIVPEQRYDELALMPALVRFATETSDTVLLSKIIQVRTSRAQPNEPNLPQRVLRTFFESQVNLRRWDEAKRILNHLKDIDNADWDHISLAYVVRAMLLDAGTAKVGKEEALKSMNHAKALFTGMVKGEYDNSGTRSYTAQDNIDMVAVMLSSLDKPWAQFCLNIQPLKSIYWFATSTSKAFNIILEGVVNAYGSTAGRKFLETFWSLSRGSVRWTTSAISVEEGKQLSQAYFSRYRPLASDEVKRKRNAISIPGEPNTQVVVYGDLQPNLMTVKTILRKSLDEFRQRSIRTGTNPVDDSRVLQNLQSDARLSSSTREMVVWGIDCLRSLNVTDDDIKDELNKILTELEMDWVQLDLPQYLEAADTLAASRYRK